MYYTSVTHPGTAQTPAETTPVSARGGIEQQDASAWPRPRVLTPSELRALAGEWRMKRDPHDAERAEKIACVLEWLAARREPPPKPKTRLQVVGERISAWVGLH